MGTSRLGLSMDIKVLRGTRTNAPAQSSNQLPIQSNEGPGLASRLGHALTRGAEAPGRFVDTILQSIGEPKLMKEPLSEKFGYSRQQLQPQGPIESYAQRVAELAPTAGLFGAPAVASTAIGAVPASVAKLAGAPEWLQDALQLGSEIGYAGYKGRIPTFKSAQKEAYKEAKATVPGTAQLKSEVGYPRLPLTENLNKEGLIMPKPFLKEGSALNTSINKVKDLLATEPSKRIKEPIEGILDTLNSKLISGKGGLNPKVALDLRKKMNRFAKTLPKDVVGEYIKPLTEGYDKFFIQYGAENPEFLNKLTKADQITAAKNMQSYVSDYINKIPDVVKLTNGVSAGSAVRGLLQSVFGTTAGGLEKTIRRVWNNPAAREIYFDAIKAAGQEDPALLFRNLNNLKEAIMPSKKESKSVGRVGQSVKQAPQITLLRGSRA